MDLDPRLESYDRPRAGHPNPAPPLIWRETLRPIGRIEGMDDSDTPLHWWVTSTAAPPWPPDEIKQMWYQLMQIYRLPATIEWRR
jgi:hypothetical protein